MYKTSLILFIFFAFQSQSNAQGYEDLDSLTGFKFNVYYSPGNEKRAFQIAQSCENAMDYVSSLVNISPTIYLFVLDPGVWKKYGQHPLYGMPHSFDAADNGTNLVVASRDNDFWKSFIPSLDELPPDLAGDIKQAYSDSTGNLSMKPFFDLLAIHELGHGFHIQGGLLMQRLWIQELFVNILLHTFVAEKEPKSLSALTVFPEMVVASGTGGFKYTKLEDFEAKYDNMAGKNYGWYQSKLHSAAKDIYEAGGEDAFIRLWNGLKFNQEKMDDEKLIKFLNEDVHPKVADVYTKWQD